MEKRYASLGRGQAGHHVVGLNKTVDAVGGPGGRDHKDDMVYIVGQGGLLRGHIERKVAGGVSTIGRGGVEGGQAMVHDLQANRCECPFHLLDAIELQVCELLCAGGYRVARRREDRRWWQLHFDSLRASACGQQESRDECCVLRRARDAARERAQGEEHAETPKAKQAECKPL